MNPYEQAPTSTTAELRREIERGYAESESREKYLEQIDALEERGIHRVERHDAQSPHIAVGDALTRELEREREEERQADIDAARERRERQDARERGRERPGELDRGRERAPEPSSAAWTKDYAVERDSEAVTYSRDGEAKIRDDGRNVQVASDERSIRDAVKLVKEQGDEKIAVRANDPEKRAAIMRECVRQNVKVACPNKEVEAEYTKAIVAVERERAQARQADRQQKTQERSHDGPEIGA